jgi:hypothetical protein
MEYLDALLKMRSWCDQSDGKPIEIISGQSVVFESRATYGEEDVAIVEGELECVLPESYRLFMSIVGASTLFGQSSIGGGPYFYSPDEILETSIRPETYVGNGSSDRFCWIGEHRCMGDFMGFLVSKPGPKNFDVFCHEYPLEEYAEVSDEIKSWRTFEDWVILSVETLGMDTL